jgi:AcrR family transcriptional regulator
VNQREDTAPDRAQRRDRRRERLMRAGRDLFAVQGYHRTSIVQVCAQARVSTRAFYEEFAGRQALLLAVHENVAAAGMEAVGAVMGAPDIDAIDTTARIGRLFDAYAAAVTQDPAAAKVAFVEVQSAGQEVEEHRLMWRALWAEFFAAEAARAVARGEAADRDHSLGMVALMGAVNELMAHWSRQAPRQAAAPAVLAAELTRMALAVLGTPRPGGAVT